MKLDRNTNPDGRGKYALINLRKNTVEWGGEDQFFVIKYRDQFAGPTLRAYASAVLDYADGLLATGCTVGDVLKWVEYADEITREAELAEANVGKRLPS